jgi:imidazolonepropionase-like amidohydrolase
LRPSRADTINPARWPGLDDQLGSIAPGQRADLVLLRKNPLESIEAVRMPVLAIRATNVVFDEREVSREMKRTKERPQRP